MFRRRWLGSLLHSCPIAEIFHTHNCVTHIFHTTLSHTTLHIQLFLLLDPPPPPLSFLPSPSRYNICCSLLEEVDLWGYPVLLFSWEPTTKISNFEITDLHMRHPCVPSNPEIKFGSKYIKINFLWCPSVRQQENNFHGG